MSNKDLVIINNEKISKEKNTFYCDNVDIKTIPEDLNSNFTVTLIARISKIKRDRYINLSNIIISSNIIEFLFKIFKTFKKSEAVYLIISITPYTFFSYLLLFLFRKKVFVYLRSSGYEEYKAIFGFIGPMIYDVMFKIVTYKSNVIKCQERLFTKRKSNIVFPSELSSEWFENLKKPTLDKPRLLYVGRIKVEKPPIVKIIRDTAKQQSKSIAILMDLPGPKIRTGDKDIIPVSRGNEYTLGSDADIPINTNLKFIYMLTSM